MTLASLYGGLAPGGYVIVDDYRAMHGVRPRGGRVPGAARDHGAARGRGLDLRALAAHERRAVRGARRRPPRRRTPHAGARSASAPACPRSERELELAAEVAELRARLARAAGAAPHRRLRGAPGDGCAAGHDRVRLRDHPPGGLRALRGAGHPPRRRARLGRARAPRRRARCSRTTTRCSTRRPRSPDLEALVLVHQDTEIVDADFCDRVRAALADDTVGVVGCVGAVGVRSIAWWEGSVSLASFVHRFGEHGGGDLPSFSWTWDEAPPVRAGRRGRHARRLPARAAALDGRADPLRRVARRAARLRPRLLPAGPRGRPQGRHGRPRAPSTTTRSSSSTTPEEWVQAHIRIAEKWDGRMPRHRHRGRAPGRSARAAPRPSATPPRLEAHARMLQIEARARELERATRGDARQHLLARHGAAAARRAAARAVREAWRVIAFGTSSPRARRGGATRSPGIGRAAEPDSAILALRVRDLAAAEPQHRPRRRRAARRPRGARAACTRTRSSTDPGLCARVRETLADPDVARGRRGGRARARKGIAWWEGEVSAAPGDAPLRRPRRGRRVPGFGWAGPSARRSARSTSSTARCWSCPRGRSAPSGSTRRCAWATGTTRTSAGRCARRAARS